MNNGFRINSAPKTFGGAWSTRRSRTALAVISGGECLNNIWTGDPCWVVLDLQPVLHIATTGEPIEQMSCRQRESRKSVHRRRQLKRRLTNKYIEMPTLYSDQKGRVFTSCFVGFVR